MARNLAGVSSAPRDTMPCCGWARLDLARPPLGWRYLVVARRGSLGWARLGLTQSGEAKPRGG